MYLARKRINSKLHYFIRQSVQAGQQGLQSQELVALGTNPEKYIIYPGGHTFYIDDIIEQKLEQAGAASNQYELEEIFWPFLKPEVRRAVLPFRTRAISKKRKQLTEDQKQALCTGTHIFDKRRLHYLKFGRMDQGYVGRMPARLLRPLGNKSRDELEQYFRGMEKQVLKRHELKTYVYVVFNLQRFFNSPMARQYPDCIDEALIDDHFVEEICRLNCSENFWAGESHGQGLNECLVRYLIMYFDNAFAERSISNDFFSDFINRHKRFTGYPQKVTVGVQEASEVFEVSQETLNNFSKRELIRQYRRMAQKHHPDTGGDHDKFIRLTEAFHSMLHKRH